ncbi:hypothetical protein NQT62_06950 [Limnobacter humi]|uniref:Uncharacterized protein n=1 Tax=Limnobacter humi TaxID=1778671 RepID=A0ABT1WF87_9BURK|nr:hypothetical protein [Limnobacter humi]MCQ8896175.1 hypothetical protein [Limnobacter humi]
MPQTGGMPDIQPFEITMVNTQNDTLQVQTAADILAAPDAAPSMPAVVDQTPPAELAVPVVEQAPTAIGAQQTPPVQAEVLPDEAPVQDAASAAVDNPEDTEAASMGLFGGLLGGGFAALTPATAAAGALGVAFVASNNSGDDSAPAPASGGGTLSGATSQLPAEITGPIGDSPLGDPLNMVVSGVDSGSSALPTDALPLDMLPAGGGAPSGDALPISSLPTDALPTSSLPLPV